MELKVKESVYEPMEDSHMMQREIEIRAKGKKVLDIGTGSGIQAITAALAGAKEVWAADVNPIAVRCAQSNAEANNCDINFVESDLFTYVPKKKFDLIVFNPPYLPSDGIHEDLRWSGGLEGIEVILDFLSQVKPFLARDGAILFIYSSYANPDRLAKMMKRFGFKLEVVSQKHIFFEDIFVGLATIG
ncbi:methyltransferase [Candidatus Woesearchaeota archaeon]|jgi:release factor glutamine methyltransferase|nr:methyltransferase [Candidatus Woesearchaeota archaeon]MBT4114672.1 methyltransferase [Candidatus Woesearchaeota archaeon]MBT4248524.1 methyltransferase [Candidatus Woesearchaeota archaeon]